MSSNNGASSNSTAWSSVFRPGLLKGRVCIVTGGGTGIGKHISRELLDLGANVVIASRRQDIIDAAVKELSENVNNSSTYNSNDKPRVVGTICNIREENDVKRLYEFTLKTFNKFTDVVNCAGGQFPSPVEAISAKGWRSVIDLNLNGTFLMCKYAFESGMNENGGNIVNIVADFHNGFPGMAHTGSARAGVDNLTKTLAVEWSGYGIRVNCVAPGVIYNKSATAHYEKVGQPGLLEEQAFKVPAGRLGSVEEVSSAVCFLLSPGANYISGACIRVDGASSLRPTLWDVMPPNAVKWPIYGEPFAPANKEGSDNQSKL